MRLGNGQALAGQVVVANWLGRVEQHRSKMIWCTACQLPILELGHKQHSTLLCQLHRQLTSKGTLCCVYSSNSGLVI